MKTVTVCASKKYDVKIGSKLLKHLGQEARQLVKSAKAVIISDSNVWPIYGTVAKESLESAAFEVLNYVIPAGESSKNGNTYLSILNFLAECHFTRSDLLIALGGGVVGDMTGFVAATYLRGVDYIQIPTSLLAMVDSSVGGKTAIDLPSGKNLAGAFYQPILVLCDIEALNSLPDETFSEGCAEVIKYGILYDAELFKHLQKNVLNFDRESVIARCVELKRNVVADDEFDRGARQKLNLGHTIGHGIEAASNFALSHGASVAIGTAIIANAAGKYGICTAQTTDQIIEVLKAFNLPTQTEICSDTIFENALSDKKRSGYTVNLIVPKKIGECLIKTVSLVEMKSYIETGLL